MLIGYTQQDAILKNKNNSLGIVDVFTSRYQATHVPSRIIV
jgi:hypothetical protein